MNKICFNGFEFATESEPRLDAISFRNGKIPEYITGINQPISASEEVIIECDVSTINTRLLKELAGLDWFESRKPYGITLECKQPYQVQIRRHKKKRINKKWAKRYGYETKFKMVKMTDVHFDQRRDEFGVSEMVWSGRIELPY